ncbi:glycosyltransferase family protein [Phormidesmis sp. 146-33]
MKIMFYCQYLAGMGHLVRSTEIIRSLVKDFQVCFVNGGQPIEGFQLPSGVEVINLPAILEEDGELKAVDSSQNIEGVKQCRTQALLNAFEQFQPDGLITECFPFSKHKVKFELIPLLDRAKASVHPVKVVCSLRDLIMTQARAPKVWAKRYDAVCDLINQYYDLILVHDDPQLQRLEEFFPKVSSLNCEVYYTGYVAQSSPQVPLTAEDQAIFNQNSPMIIVSVGGGRFGYELLNAVASASAILEQKTPHHIHAFTGPFMPEEQVLQLEQAIAQQKNMTIRRYTAHLIDYLNRADISISLGGYNTTMNILKTGVRSLIYPAASEEQMGEQTSRATMLAAMGVLDLLQPEDLVGDRLAQKVLASLDREPVAHAFDLQGAENSALRLKQLLYRSVMVA